MSETGGKNILAVYYSQSGQLESIVQKFVSPFSNAGCDVDLLAIHPETDFPFPWTGKKFFDAMPESVLGIPANILLPVFKHEKYDLIILAYQPWFLSPSIPATSILHHPDFKARLNNTPVITLIGARNMWITAQKKMKCLLKSAGALLVGNIVLTDRKPNLISAVTIQYWMFTGKKDKMLGIFPTPGVSENDINLAADYGAVVMKSLFNNNLQNLQSELVAIKAVVIKPIIMFVESRASVLFALWAKLIIKKKNRSLWVTIFKYYLIIALFVLSPLVITIYMIFFRPFIGRKIKAQQDYYLSVQYA